MIDDIQRPTDLILKLLEKGPKYVGEIKKTLKESHDISSPTVMRHISNLLNKKDILQIQSIDWEKYGIKDQDKRHTYYVLAAHTEQAKYYDTVIRDTESEDLNIQAAALEEICQFEEINLLPPQLFKLSNILTKGEAEQTHKILELLFKHADKCIFPSDIKQFQNNLVICFHIFRNSTAKNIVNIRTRVLFFLGLLENKWVIDYLKKDIGECKDVETISESPLSGIISDYEKGYLAPIYEKHNLELFNFLKTLPEVKREAVNRIRRESKIRQDSKQYERQKLALAKLKEQDETTLT